MGGSTEGGRGERAGEPEGAHCRIDQQRSNILLLPISGSMRQSELLIRDILR